MKHKKCNFLMIFFVLFVFSAVHAIATEDDDDIPKITKEEVQKIIGQSDVTDSLL
jgi:hypothetical protein